MPRRQWDTWGIIRGDYCTSHSTYCSACTLYNVHCTLGWSDFHFFVIFENGHIAADWLYYYEFNSKKSANFDLRQNFNFQKITETLKISILFWKFVNIFLLLQRTIFFHFYFRPQKCAKRFLTGSMEKQIHSTLMHSWVPHVLRILWENVDICRTHKCRAIYYETNAELFITKQKNKTASWAYYRGEGFLSHSYWNMPILTLYIKTFSGL